MAELLGTRERRHEVVDVETGRRLHQEILRCGEDAECAQAACNRVFTTERREKMITEASVDRKGRKVRYYRHIKRDVFLRALEEGGHFVDNNHMEDFDQKVVNEKEVKIFFLLYFQKNDGESYEEMGWDIKKAGDISLQEILDAIFSDSFVRESFPKRLTNRNVVDFVRRFCCPRTLEELHMLGQYLDFSPYLSASVGGSYLEKVSPGAVLLELILPDELILSDPDATPFFRMEEKSVCVDGGFPLEAISRVFCTTHQYWKEVVLDENTPVGMFLSGSCGRDSIQPWLMGEQVENCLPVGILRRYESEL